MKIIHSINFRRFQVERIQITDDQRDEWPSQSVTISINNRDYICTNGCVPTSILNNHWMSRRQCEIRISSSSVCILTLESENWYVMITLVQITRIYYLSFFSFSSHEQQIQENFTNQCEYLFFFFSSRNLQDNQIHTIDVDAFRDLTSLEKL